MYLGTYRFQGDPDELLAGYDRMMASFPQESLLVHLCVRGDDGITIIDTCPSEADFRAFSTSAEFRSALGAAGLPEPVVDAVGDVHLARTPAGPVPIG
jgi:hypothetical protein